MKSPQALGFYSLLYLAQAIAVQNLNNSLHIGVVSSNIHNVTGTETICPEKATLLGTCRVIPQEYAHLTCSNIDLSVADFSNSELSDRLITEIASKSADTVDTVVAYRENYRWLPTYEPVRLEQHKDKGSLREQGVYLITGGWGGIGLTIAKYLAEAVRAKLVLVSRSLLPKEKWADGDHEEATAAKNSSSAGTRTTRCRSFTFKRRRYR